MRPIAPHSFASRYLLRLSLLGIAALALGTVSSPQVAFAKQPTTNRAPADRQSDEGEEEEEASELDGSKDADKSPDSETDSGESEPAPQDAEDLDQLRAEYFKLRDRLFQSRARASAVASALYSTRLSVRLDYDSARYYTVTRATIRLDGANIFDDTGGAIASDDANRFEGYIAPGRHQLSIRIEATGKDDQRFTTVIDNSFVVQASKGKDLEVKVSAQDRGNIAYNWSKKERGSYQLHMNVDVKTVKRSSKKQNTVKRASRMDKAAPEVESRG